MLNGDGDDDNMLSHLVSFMLFLAVLGYVEVCNVQLRSLEAF
jgi:hypothetical protein